MGEEGRGGGGEKNCENREKVRRGKFCDRFVHAGPRSEGDNEA